MKMKTYVDTIRLQLTGSTLPGKGYIEMEIDDDQVEEVVNMSLRELQRYIATTRLIEVSYDGRPIDLRPYKVNSVSRVFRTHGFLTSSSDVDATKRAGKLQLDPMYASMWGSLYGYGNIYNTSNWIYNIAAWNTTQQIANTLTTDLEYKYNKDREELYVTCSFNTPQQLTIEVVPEYPRVEDVTSPFWQNTLQELSVAHTKVILGRIRSKFAHSNSLWSIDTSILDEGNQELQAIRERMRSESMTLYVLD